MTSSQQDESAPDFSAECVLDEDGYGVVMLAPDAPDIFWYIERIKVSVSTNEREAECYTYIRLGATSTGSTGDSMTLRGSAISRDYPLVNTWEGGDPGAVATLACWGETR